MKYVPVDRRKPHLIMKHTLVNRRKPIIVKFTHLPGMCGWIRMAW